MWFVAIGVAMLLMNLAGIGPIGAWTWKDMWWAMLLPYGLAVAWWTWSDLTGHTQRKAMERDEAKRAERRERNAEALGLKLRSTKKPR
ncbi:MAG: hypothetical protein RI907_3998 [Pseudomonadota bacterium]